MRLLSNSKRAVSPAFLASLVIATSALAQTPSQSKPSEEGIPVTNKLVIEKCGACHVRDSKGNMTRISWSGPHPKDGSWQSNE
jgi:quinohemoprotein amine dehydrogenase